MYNFYLWSDDRVKIQHKILREIIFPQMQFTRYDLRTRTTIVVFVLPVLRPNNPEKSLYTLGAQSLWCLVKHRAPLKVLYYYPPTSGFESDCLPSAKNHKE